MNKRKILKVLFLLCVFIIAATSLEGTIKSMFLRLTGEEPILPEATPFQDEIGVDPEQTSSQDEIRVDPEPTLFQEETEISPEPTQEPETQEMTEEPTSTETAEETETPTNPTEPPIEAPEDSNVISPYSDNYGSPYVDGALSNKKAGWYYNPNNEHQPPTASRDFDIRQFGGYYLGDIYAKNIYLTFDEGYENGYSALILDVLKEKGVKAAFFVTKPYIEEQTDLIKRMVNEGHLVGNHSVKHLSSPDLSDDEFVYELEETARYYKEVTGYEMKKYFRPPMGEYSARTLKLSQDLGYKTIFWSFAYKDWETDNQPGKNAAYDTIVSRMHNGSIVLLHAVSQSNTEALPDVIDKLKADGYVFRTLEELP